MAKVKCKQCKQQIDKSQAFSPRPKAYFCNEDCSNQWDEEHKPKEVSVEERERKELINYLYDLYDKDIPMMVFKQIKDYHDNKNYKYSGMLLTLKFMYEIEGLYFNKEKGIGLLEYKYDEAKRHFLQKRDIKQSIKDVDLESIERYSIKVDKSKEKVYNRFDVNDL